MKEKLKKILFPFSFLYAGILRTRHWLFDKNIFKSASFNFPIICVGNIATGGTGKTPMTEYLVEMLKNHFTIATLSRGYKRKTKGFAIADKNTTAIDIGDEPMQFHVKYPDITVAVGEERLVAIPQLLHAMPETEVIILDDAFQHRQVKAGFNILLTDYKNMYYKDFLVPAGNLRDIPQAANRAQVIVVTKCPCNMDNTEKEKIMNRLKPVKDQHVFFTENKYGRPYHIFNKQYGELRNDTSLLLITGIANPAYMIEFLKRNTGGMEVLQFSDHHIFTSDDLKNIKVKFTNISRQNKLILTTEKDSMRLQKFEKELSGLPVYCLPVQHHFLFYEAGKFENLVMGFIQSFKK